nr:hypothetical protein [Tanacetum cinerariifolium]
LSVARKSTLKSFMKHLLHLIHQIYHLESINLMEWRKAMMGTFVKKIFKSVLGFRKSLTGSLLKSRDFILKIGGLRKRKEAVHELGYKIIPSCDRIRSVAEEEGLHKGYDRFQNILSQLNQMQAKPDNDDVNIKFLRALPPSWSQVALTLKIRGGLEYLSFDDLYNKLGSLEIDVKGGLSYGSRSTIVAPTHSAFIGAASTNIKMVYSDQPSHSSSITYTSAHFGSIMEDVLHSFVAENKPTQQLAYENFKQVDQLEIKELDIKWQMAMLSLRINKFQKKARRKINFNNKDSTRFDRRKARCYNCLQLGYFARECNVKKVDEKARYSAFKISETEEGEHVYGLMAGFELDFADQAGIVAGSVYNVAAEFAMMGISPKVQTCPFGCDSQLSELKKNYDHLEKLYNDLFIQVKTYKNTVKTLELQKDWYHKTQLALEEKVRILSANLENTTNTLKYFETLYDQAKIEKKEWEVKFVESLARFDKWNESSKNLAKWKYSSMSTKTKLGLGFKEYIGSDEVCDLSTPSVFDLEPENKEVKSLYERFVKAGRMHEVPPPITGTFMPTSYKSDLEETQATFGSKSNTSSINTFDSNDFVSCDNSEKSSASETYIFASCVSSPKTNDSFSPVDVNILPKSDVKDPSPTNGFPSCSFKENVKPPTNLCNKSGKAERIYCKNNFVRTKKCFVCGSKSHLIKDCDVYDTVYNFPFVISKEASVPAGSRNSSASTSAGRSIPAASRNRPASIYAGRHIPAGRFNKPTPFPAGRSVPTGWTNPAARPFFRPPNLYFDNVSWPGIYKHMSMNEGRWGTAIKSSAGNKEKLDDLMQIKGGTVTFAGGDGKITGKGTIRTSKLNFENVYYEFQLPDASQVVLRIPRRHDLYTFNLSDIQPGQQINYLLAKASLEESTKWHKRMAHVNFNTINKLAKHGLVEGLPLKLFTNEDNCVACNKGKQHKASYKAISAVRTISELLQLLHMDLFDPTSIRSTGIEGRNKPKGRLTIVYFVYTNFCAGRPPMLLVVLVFLLVVLVHADGWVSAGSCTILTGSCTIPTGSCTIPTGSYTIPTGSYSFMLLDWFLLDNHNKVSYLEKRKGWEAYEQILDFLNKSHIRYALTHHPPIVFDSLVKQFWATATVRTLEAGPSKIIATIDGNEVVVTESLIRTQLQLNDVNGLYEFTLHDVLDGMTYNFFRFILDGMIRNVGSKSHNFFMYPRFLQMILGIQTIDPSPRPTFDFTAKLFSNMKLNWDGPHMPLLAPMLVGPAGGDGPDAVVAGAAAANEVPPPPPPPDVPLTHISSSTPGPFSAVQDTPVREPTPVKEPTPSLVREPTTFWEPTPDSPRPPSPLPSPRSEEVGPTTSTRPPSPTRQTSFQKDISEGGDDYVSSPKSNEAPPTTAATAVGGAEDSAALTDLSLKLDRCINRVTTLENEFGVTKKVLGGVVLKLVSRIKRLEGLLQQRKRRLVLSDSEGEEAATKEQDIDLDALHKLASTSLGGDTTVEAAYTIYKASQDAHASSNAGHDADDVPNDTTIPFRHTRTKQRRLRKTVTSSAFEHFQENISAVEDTIPAGDGIPADAQTIPAGSTPIPSSRGVSAGSSMDPASQAAAAAALSSTIPAADKGKAPMVDDSLPADLLTEQE